MSAEKFPSLSDSFAIPSSDRMNNLLIIDRFEKIDAALHPGITIIQESELRPVGVNSEEEFESQGCRMKSLLAAGFQKGYKKVVLLSSSFNVSDEIIRQAFEALNSSELVLGPTSTGGFYLYGMKQLYPSLFTGKPWDSPFLNYQFLLDATRSRIPYTLLDFISVDAQVKAS